MGGSFRDAVAQQSLTWDQVKTHFEAANPTLQADQANVEEMKAEEITAYLRPNPQFGLTVDGTQIVPKNGVWQPLAGTFIVPSISYLHERDHKRELRLQSAQQGTHIAQSQHEDLAVGGARSLGGRGTSADWNDLSQLRNRT